MTKRVLALGLDPAFANLEQMPRLTPEMIKAYIDSQLARLRDPGCRFRPRAQVHKLVLGAGKPTLAGGAPWRLVINFD